MTATHKRWNDRCIAHMRVAVLFFISSWLRVLLQKLLLPTRPDCRVPRGEPKAIPSASVPPPALAVSGPLAASGGPEFLSAPEAMLGVWPRHRRAPLLPPERRGFVRKS